MEDRDEEGRTELNAIVFAPPPSDRGVLLEELDLPDGFNGYIPPWFDTDVARADTTVIRMER